MKNNILLLDGSRRFHVRNALAVLGDMHKIRWDLDVRRQIDPEFIENMNRQAYNHSRNQVDIAELGLVLISNDYLHRQNKDATKIILTDQDLFDSREKDMNFVFGVTLPFRDGNNYVIVSGSRMRDELHLRHVIRHELGHVFGAPNSRRQGVYESLGAHCPDGDCTMHQELNVENSYKQAVRIHNLGRYFCEACKNDIRS